MDVCAKRTVAAVALLLVWCGGAFALGPQVTESTLPNGARLFVSEQRNVPMVVMQVVVDAGARRDPPERAGLAGLTADLVTEGTTTRSAAAISEAVDQLGAGLDVNALTDLASASLRVLKQDFDAGLVLLADVILHPTFPEAEVVRRKEALLASIRAQRDNPNDVAEKAFQRALFDDQPYGHPVEGTEETVARIRRADVEAFYRRFYQPDRALIVVVGDIAPDDARRRIESAFDKWKGTGEAPFQYPQESPPSARVVRIDKPVTQASIILGERGVARNNPDYETLSVMNYVLGSGGFSSRLMISIRTEAGLAYSVGSLFTVNSFPGSFQIVMQTKNATVGEAVTRAQREVERIRTEPVTDDELAEAKRYLTGSFALKLDSNTKIAQFIGQAVFYGLGLNYADTYLQKVNAVTKEDVLRVAQSYLHPDQFIEVIVGDLGRTGAPEDATP